MRLLIGVILILATAGYGEIVFSLYTVSGKVLKMTAQLTAQSGSYPKTVKLETNDGSTWDSIAAAPIKTAAKNSPWISVFRIPNWDDTRDTPYRLTHGKSTWSGVIRKNPVDKEVIVVAAFTGNSIRAADGGTKSKQDLIDNSLAHDADLLFFSGDQVYNHTHHFRDWAKFGRDFGALMKDLPTVSIPDDHDVGMPNIWGSGGKKSTMAEGVDGGYYRPVSYVKMVEAAQTSHLPDPYDPTPIEQGIGVYYTSLRWGGVDFAIIEDRKFKTGPKEILPKKPGTDRWDHINDPDLDPMEFDAPGAKLLGERQLNFLYAWGQDWAGVEMKATLSATIFGNIAHLHGGGKEANRLIADMDSNGWPQSGRKRALDMIRRSFAFMIGGDQHLGSVVHHGIDDWNDAGVSFCVPSIANFYPRYWSPTVDGADRAPGEPGYMGRHLDGFRNKVTIRAVANPTVTARSSNLRENASGYGIIRFDKKNRTITMEAWPRNLDPKSAGAQPYKDWPVVTTQEQQYGRKPAAYLPTLNITGMTDPVVQVINEKSDSVEYTIRIKGSTFRPKVFDSGTYTLKVGEPGTGRMVTKSGVSSLDTTISQTMEIALGTPVQKEGVGKRKHGKPTVKWDKSVGMFRINKTDHEPDVIEIYDLQGKLSVRPRKVSAPGTYYLSAPAARGTYVVHFLRGTAGKAVKITVTE